MSDLFAKLEVAAWGGLVGPKGRLFHRKQPGTQRVNGSQKPRDPGA
jgi:hypothetical protein